MANICGLEHNKWECRVLIGQFAWLKALWTPVCNVVRFERIRNDDSRTLHVLN